jgi:hypothetical protein
MMTWSFTVSRTPSSALTKNVYGSEDFASTRPSHRTENVSLSMPRTGDLLPQSKSIVSSERSMAVPEKFGLSKYVALSPCPAVT